MFVRTPWQFYVMRFLVGVAEAGLFPSVVYYCAGWFPMAYRGRAFSRIYVATSLASIAMGVVSAAYAIKPRGLDYRSTVYSGENHNSVRLASFPSGLYWVYRPAASQ